MAKHWQNIGKTIAYMTTVKAVLRLNTRDKNGKGSILVRITKGNSHTTHSLRRYIYPKYWNEKSVRSKVRANCPGASHLNIKINNTVDAIQGIIDQQQSNNYTPKSIVNKYRNQINSEVDTILFNYIKAFVDSNPDNLSYVTLKNYKKVNNCLHAYKPFCDIREIDINWIKDYEKFLLKKGKAVNTRYDRMKILRKITKRAYEYGVIDEYPFKFYKAKTEESKREYLTIDELKKVEQFEPKNNSQKLCKDIFLFSCYTGLRFSDMCTLTGENFKQEEKVIMSLRMQKTNALIQFPLPDKAVDILEKYKGSHYSLPILKFPIKDFVRLKTKISSRNAYFNKVLKGIIAETKIDKAISFHCARHTFATIGLTLGIRIEVLQKLLGHKNIRETQIYAKIVDEQKEQAIELWNKF